MKDRIFKVMKWSGLNLSQFAEAIQVSPALLSSVKTERTKPTLLLIENIKKVYPDIDINWLITGEGEMIVGAAGGLLIAANPTEETDSARKEEATVGVPRREEKPEPAESSKPEKRKAVTIAADPIEEDGTVKEGTAGQAKRAVRQVLLMYNDGTYESFEK